MELGFSRSITPWRARCRGRTPTAARPARCTWAAPSSEVAAAEAEVAAGRHPEAPYVLVTQAGVVDPSRAPAGRHTLWAYCHVPAGSTVDMTARVEAQIERFAPGFRDLVLARHARTAADEEAANPNYVGGDIAAGMQTVWQTVFRPVPRWNPYRTPLPGVYLCSSSTPPLPGVHGRCGELAALTALRDVFGLRSAPDLGPRPAEPGGCGVTARGSRERAVITAGLTRRRPSPRAWAVTLAVLVLATLIGTVVAPTGLPQSFVGPAGRSRDPADADGHGRGRPAGRLAPAGQPDRLAAPGIGPALPGGAERDRVRTALRLAGLVGPGRGAAGLPALAVGDRSRGPVPAGHPAVPGRAAALAAVARPGVGGPGGRCGGGRAAGRGDGRCGGAGPVPDHRGRHAARAALDAARGVRTRSRGWSRSPWSSYGWPPSAARWRAGAGPPGTGASSSSGWPAGAWCSGRRWW